jgi:hypothetical protein
MSSDNALTCPPIGSAWHARDGRNVFVSDVSQRNGETRITFTTEIGRSLRCSLDDLGRTFRRGYAR